MNTYLFHHGILGQKWGVRRYQNPDGSLTELGKERLGIASYTKDHDQDITVRKGTKVTRWVSTNRYDEYNDYGKGKEYLDKTLANDRLLDTKYVSVDGVRNSNRRNGKEFYEQWFTNEGYDPNSAVLTTYALKKDIRIASGEKVVNALLREYSSKYVTDLIKSGKSIRELTMNYTLDKQLFNKVNEQFRKLGYDAVEDINDSLTDMPLIVFNSDTVLGKAVSIDVGRATVRDQIKRYRDRPIKNI